MQGLLRILCTFLAGTLATAAATAPHAEPAFVTHTRVYTSREEGYHTYRIPALLSTPRGTLLAFCEGRRAGRGDSGDIDLMLRRSEDRGGTWSAQRVLWDDAGNTCGNPCAVVDGETGVIWLLLTWNRGDDTEQEIVDGRSADTRRVYVASSHDDGVTWRDRAR